MGFGLTDVMQSFRVYKIKFCCHCIGIESMEWRTLSVYPLDLSGGLREKLMVGRNLNVSYWQCFKAHAICMRLVACLCFMGMFFVLSFLAA